MNSWKLPLAAQTKGLLLIQEILPINHLPLYLTARSVSGFAICRKKKYTDLIRFL